ncbi:MAG: iron-containing alcohol dehydrogenase [Oscillospiraceae bacterium]|nr:iron-containing alcohol dehydrogenase [Oscillospiraceae bacterium]
MKSYAITDKCIGCTLCAKQCPVNAISGELKQKHIIDEDKCIRCGLCGRVCPQNAVNDENGKAVEKQPKKDWKKPYIKHSCVGCSVCVEVCPQKCLKISDAEYRGDINTKAVLINEKDCIGCGLCKQACPIDAITMHKTDETVTEETKGANSMYKTFCRTFQFVMKIGNYALPYRMPEYIEGPDSVLRLPAWIKEKGVKNVLVVTDNGLMKIGLPEPMFEAMKKEGVKFTVFSDIEPNPTSDNVEAGYKLFKENNCDGLVAFGGGAPMDCAKAIGARVARPRKSVAQLQGLLKVMKKIPIFFAVPTTSGTGSETTVAAVITDSKTHHKASINDTALIPKYAVLDPKLTIGLPPFVTATTGMDALCHAVEAYTNYTYLTKLEKKLALDAIRLIHENLLVVYKDGKNMQARQNMQKAAFYAGRAFTRGCVGYVHAVGHTLGGLYGVPHGLAMSVILPHVMRQFGPAVYDKLADCADVCGMQGADNREKALKFIEWIDDLKVQMSLPAGMDMIQQKDIPQIIKWASAEANPLYPVPVIWGKQDFIKLLHTLKTAK